MPRQCTCCAHPERRSLDKALIRGVPATTVAARFKVGEDAVQRHRENHLRQVLQRASEIGRGVDLLDEIRRLQRRVDGVVAKALRAGDLKTGISGLKELREHLVLLSRLVALANAERAVEEESLIPIAAFRELQRRAALVGPSLECLAEAEPVPSEPTPVPGASAALGPPSAPSSAPSPLLPLPEGIPRVGESTRPGPPQDEERDDELSDVEAEARRTGAWFPRTWR